MQKSDFRGVLPALTTRLTADQEVDHAALSADVEFQISAGVDALIMCGSLGEASSLDRAEKLAIARTALDAAAGRVPVLLTIAEDSTRNGASLAAEAEQLGIAGLMVLPAMRYLADTREVIAHYRAVAAASGLPIIVYNNPLAYGIDITPAALAELADEPKFVAVKESTGDTRRINETLNALGDRYQLLTGVDDLALESLVLGCVGWIAGLVVAFPRETVAIYKLVQPAASPRRWKSTAGSCRSSTWISAPNSSRTSSWSSIWSAASPPSPAPPAYPWSELRTPTSAPSPPTASPLAPTSPNTASRIVA